MKFFVPACGQKITLEKDWTFTLNFEHRNSSLIEHLKPGTKVNWGNGDQAIEATLPKGTVLTVARVYVRNGYAGKYNSLTFSAILAGRKRSLRFWAKLDDVNQMEIETPEELLV